MDLCQFFTQNYSLYRVVYFFNSSIPMNFSFKCVSNSFPINISKPKSTGIISIHTIPIVLLWWCNSQILNLGSIFEIYLSGYLFWPEISSHIYFKTRRPILFEFSADADTLVLPPAGATFDFYIKGDGHPFVLRARRESPKFFPTQWVIRGTISLAQHPSLRIWKNVWLPS